MPKPSELPFGVTNNGVLKFPDTLVQITLRIPKEHGIIFTDKFMEQVTELVVLFIAMILSAHIPQLEAILYWSVEQLESTAVQLTTSCSELMPTNWTLVGGGGGSIDLDKILHVINHKTSNS